MVPTLDLLNCIKRSNYSRLSLSPPSRAQVLLGLNLNSVLEELRHSLETSDFTETVMLSNAPAANSELEQAIPFIQPWLQVRPCSGRENCGRKGTSASCPCPFTPLSSRRQPSPVTALKAAVLWHDAQQEEGKAAGSRLVATLQGLGRNRKWGNWEEIIQLTLWCKVPKSSEGNANPAQKTSASFSPILTFS